MFNTFPFNITEINIWGWGLILEFNLEAELNFLFEQMKINNYSQKRIIYFFQSAINSSYGMIF